jgi:hypothetical protein
MHASESRLVPPIAFMPPAPPLAAAPAAPPAPPLAVAGEPADAIEPELPALPLAPALLLCMVAGVELAGVVVVADEPPRALFMAAVLLMAGVLDMLGAELPPLMAAGGDDTPAAPV